VQTPGSPRAFLQVATDNSPTRKEHPLDRRLLNWKGKEGGCNWSVRRRAVLGHSDLMLASRHAGAQVAIQRAGATDGLTRARFVIPEVKRTSKWLAIGAKQMRSAIVKFRQVQPERLSLSRPNAKSPCQRRCWPKGADCSPAWTQPAPFKRGRNSGRSDHTAHFNFNSRDFVFKALRRELSRFSLYLTSAFWL
jgi:hypothetical protein